MLVSVIIPTYNRAEILRETLQSVIDQTYRPVECIVVDDGSADTTKEVVHELMKGNNTSFTIKYIYKQNAGAQAARNTGTAASAGELIQYLDSDDLLYPEKLQVQVNYLQAHPSCDAVFGDWEEGIPGNKKKIIAYKKDDLLLQLFTERCIANFAVLFKKSLVEKTGDWDIAIKRNQEIDFHLRGVLLGGKFEYQPGITGLWRHHASERIGNTTTFADAIHFYRKWEGVFKEKKLWNEEFSTGMTHNYLWFLGNYPYSSNKEIACLLREIHRLQPTHPIFTNPKFKMLKSVIGFNNAAHFWATRYKKSLRKANV